MKWLLTVAVLVGCHFDVDLKVKAEDTTIEHEIIVPDASLIVEHQHVLVPWLPPVPAGVDDDAGVE